MSGRDVKSCESAQDLCRQRQEEMINIRKNKRIQNLQKRRAMAQASTATADSGRDQVVSSTGSESNNKGTVATVEQLPTIAATLKTMTPAQRYEATRSVRRLLSRQEHPPAADVIKAGLVPILVAELGLVSEEKTQFEAAWALTNIASTEHTRVIVQAGAIPSLVKLMMSKNADIREQCLWCLGNVAGDGYDMRDLVLKVPGSLNNLLLNIKHAATPSLLGNATWTLSNFCRGKPQPDINVIKPALPYLAKLITHQNMDVVGDACWALSYISDGDDDRIQACLDMNIVPTLMKLLQASKVSVVTPSLRTLGNIVSGNDSQTQAVIDGNVYAAIAPLLNHSKRTVRKEASWALSNIAAGTPPQVNSLIAQKPLLMRIMELLESDDFEVRKEAAWVISNICTGGSTANIDAIVEMGALNVIVSVMDISDVKIALVALEALEAILRKSGSIEYATMVEELGGVDKLEDLQDHNSEEIYKKAVSIVESFFNEEEEDDDEEDDQNVFGSENQDPVALPAAKGAANPFGGFNTNNAAADPFGSAGLDTTTNAMNWGF
eukprot:INCI182.1.p1 GENE.INCI182.1~~INCI182.1.p1  ORF type:complete len:583 (-),score=143.66 INCI182.1:404-2056(-)